MDSADDIFVISGMSGMFPCSRNIKEYENNLYNKVNMVNDDESRWKHTNSDIPRYSGKIPNLTGFDAKFFKINMLQAEYMDPQIRILLEESFKAVLDAGVNPLSLRGSNTGVYIGGCYSEAEQCMFYDQNIPSGIGITGVMKGMFAHRIAHYLGLTGPSFLCDTACSSSTYAFDLAYSALCKGEIDAAIVGGTNLCLHPNVTMHFAALGVLSRTGHCSPFDNDANGYTRSEAVCCLFLQRKSVAKRIYATIVNSRTNCDGYKPEGVTYPSSTIQEQLLRQLYTKANIDLDELGYVEAHSTGTVVGDPEECRAIDNAICSNRREPLLVGSVKSNCGHTEASSGMCAIVKVLLALQNNKIPPNINLKSLREEIDCLREGRLRVVTEVTKLPKPYVGINSFGFGGANAHVLLKQCEKNKTDLSGQDKELLRLVTWSSRTEENAITFFSDLQNKPLDPEYLALVQSAQAGGIQGMVFRGYTVLEPTNSDTKPTVLNTKIEHNTGIVRPLVWVFSGMGSQWTAMGRPLMMLPLFKQSIQRSHNILKPLGLNLTNIINSEDPIMLNNVLHSFVGITAIQIALVDILFELEISPDYIIGHSLGELGCAYADKCLTAEQVILAAYYRGKVSMELNKIKGSMAAIGMGYQDIRSILPDSIDVACHNSSDSCTISGPTDDVENFVKQLKENNTFAKEVPCSSIAYHSRYISHFGSALLKCIKPLMPQPKLRSKKWISTSVPADEWAKPENQYCSAEYHTNNVLNRVLFEEAATHIPPNALTIEIAPHALLQSILKNAIGEGIHVGLTKRNDPNNFLFFLKALGSLYIAGLEPRIEKLYPEVKWPVSRGTPNLSHLIDFDHSHKYFVPKFTDDEKGTGMETFALKMNDKHKYLSGHQIDGRVLVPATFYLECVWRTFALSKGIAHFENCAVEFESIKFVRATTLSSNDAVQLAVTIQNGTGFFEVTESQSLVVSGYIRQITENPNPEPNRMISNIRDDSTMLQSKDFYKELKLRGYHYNGEFQGVESARCDGSYGKVKWTQNWVTFMDCMLQLSIVGFDSRNLKLPTRLRKLKIYPKYHIKLLQSQNVAEVFSNQIENKISSGGIEIIGLNASTVQRRRAPHDPVLEKYKFIAHFPAPKLPIGDIAKCCIQLVLENEPRTTLHIVEFSTTKEDIELLTGLMHAVGDLPLINGSYMLHHKLRSPSLEDIPNVERIYADDDMSQIFADIVVIPSDDFDAMNSVIMQNIESNGFVIIREKAGIRRDDITTVNGLIPIALFPSEFETIVLLQKKERIRNVSDALVCKVSASDDKFQWVKTLQEATEKSNDVIVVSQNEQFNGIMGLVNCLRKEPTTNSVTCVVIEDSEAPPFDVKLALYEKQLKLNLAINVYRKGNWGSYRHLSLRQDYPLTSRSDHVYGNIKQLGDFSSLQWLQGPLESRKALVKIVYSSLNFRDVMLASGRLPIDILGGSRVDQTCVFGFEYSGVDLKSGKHVMGMVVKAAVSSYLGEESLLTWEVPRNWSLQEAATVPVVYLTVYYAFFFTTDIRKGKSILIHAGSGGIGIAAIRVALAYGLEVYTTVSTQEKKKFLLETFPALNANNIGNSRDTSFENMITERTQGKGVDFVLNSLSEDKLLASVRCLGRGGHFLEIGKFDMANDNGLKLSAFLNELSFHAVLADNLLTADVQLVNDLKQRISEDIKSGIVKPLPSTVFKAQDIERAFRYLMSGKHIGKVLLQIHSDPESEETLPITVHPQTYFSPDLVYIVAGGLGGFGLELVDWMILRGARKIVLSSSRGLTNGYQKLRMSLWQSYSCSIIVNTSNIASASGCLELIKESMKLGEIGGIFNLAVVLKDAIFPNQNTERFEQSFQPKAFATRHMDEISRKMCPKLEYFVIFSSVSCGRGNAGQSNYGMANSVMERIIEDRVAHGLPGKAIQWGAVGEVGLVAEMAAGKIDLEIGGTLQQRISSCLEVLDVLLSSPDPIVSSMVVAEKKADSAGQSPIDYVLNTLSIRDIKSIAMTSTLAEIGMDSLMAVEIKQVFERDYDILLNPSELRNLTFAKLAELSKGHGKSAAPIKATNNDSIDESLRLLYYYVGNYARSNIIVEPINDVTDGCPIIIFPGLDGYSGEIWQNIGGNLKSPAFVLQFPKSVVKSVDESIIFAYENIISHLNERGTNNFRIVAYSYGTLIAHKTLELLEKCGFKGKAIYIDGSITWLNLIAETIHNTYAQDDFEKLIIGAILSSIVPTLSLKTIKIDLQQNHSKTTYMHYIRETLEMHGIKNIPPIIDYIETIFIKSQHILEPKIFQSVGVIDSPVLLLKPTMPSILNIDEFYGLKSFTKNTVQAKTLEGNHQSILKHTDLPHIINTYFN